MATTDVSPIVRTVGPAFDASVIGWRGDDLVIEEFHKDLSNEVVAPKPATGSQVTLIRSVPA